MANDGIPRAMASLIFGQLENNPLYDDEGQAPRYALERVRYWRTHHRRLTTFAGQLDRTTAERQADSDVIGRAIAQLEGATYQGQRFTIEADTPVGVSFSGSLPLFRHVFGLDPFELAGHAVSVRDAGVISLVGSELAALSSAAIEINPYAVPASGVARRTVLGGLAATALTACVGDGPVSKPRAESPSLLDDPIAELLDPLGLSAVAETGSGVRVAVVDSGFAFDEIGGETQTLEAGPPVGDLNPRTDERGHGTAVLHHLLSTAPGVHVRSSKYTDHSGVRNYPVAAFQRAVYPQGRNAPPWPHVVLCSWVMADFSVALKREIAHAVSQGITVIFAAGNGSMRDVAPEDVERAPIPLYEHSEALGGSTIDDDLDLADFGVLEPRARVQRPRQVHAVAHPDALVVGGTTPSGRLDDPGVAAHYASRVYAENRDQNEPARTVPEVCGLVAPIPTGARRLPGVHRTRTAVGSVLDDKPDGGTFRDGVALTSGTSMAAAQVAGVVARLKEAYPSLSPQAVRNVLMATARRSSKAEDPRSGWDARTGFGLVDGRAALNWIVRGKSAPYVRARLDDPGDPGKRRLGPAEKRARRESSPDIFLRRGEPELRVDAEVRWTLPARHFDGLSQTVDPGKRAWLYVRVTNRGELVGETPFRVYRIEGADVPTVGRTWDGEVVVEGGGFVVSEGVAVEVTRATQAWVVGLGEVDLDLASWDALLEQIDKTVEMGIRWMGGKA